MEEILASDGIKLSFPIQFDSDVGAGSGRMGKRVQLNSSTKKLGLGWKVQRNPNTRLNSIRIEYLILGKYERVEVRQELQ